MGGVYEHGSSDSPRTRNLCFICSLSHTQILIEFIVTTFMFVAFVFVHSSLLENMEFYD